MSTGLFRSIVRRCRLLSLLSLLSLTTIAVVSLLGPPPAVHAAVDGAAFYVMLPLVTQASPAQATADTSQAQVVALTNQYRQQHGCPPLTISAELSTAAQGHSQEMADHNYFSHVDLSGHRSGWRAQQAGYSGSAGWENLSAGAATADAVVAGWYNETPPNDGHRRNMLDCSLTEVGIGFAANPNSDYGSYWTQDFGIR